MAEAKAWVMIPKVKNKGTECEIDMRPMVLCKDCKHRPTQTEPGKEGFTLDFPDTMCPCGCEDGYYSWYPKDDWFCAYGELAES
jgi:hypothetical protein